MMAVNPHSGERARAITNALGFCQYIIYSG